MKPTVRHDTGSARPLGPPDWVAHPGTAFVADWLLLYCLTAEPTEKQFSSGLGSPV